MRQLFLDCDGVLADMDGGYEKHFGIRPNRAEVPAKDFWGNVQQHGKFFLELDLLPDALELWEGAKKFHPRPIIITGLPHSVPHCDQHKRQWIRTYIDPDVQVICCASKNKYKYGNSDDVLIDDWAKYQDLWEAMGGIFVLHTSAKESLRQLQEIYGQNA